MTATAYKLDRRHIKESLGLHNCFELVANSDRKNIFYEKTFRYRHWYIDALEDICRPIYCSVCKTQCLCVECSLDMERERFYLIRQYFWACEIFLTLYQMNTQLITNVNFVELSFFKVGTSCTMFTLSHIYVIICIYKLNLLHGQYKNPYSSARTKF
jgi:superfamily II DNA helicase RecQ